ncbi:MAG: WecB/TagA/CpsF family glycosyltransferase [Balneola sp.]|nr:WecB/TagA/CpsF family glycosyltransferase [Balneola sp.]
MKLKDYILYDRPLNNLGGGKLFISTLNAHSYNVSRKDFNFSEALSNSDVLIPDGISVVWALKFLTGKELKKIAGADLFFYEMNRLQQKGGACFFLGSTEETLQKIKERAAKEYPNVKIDTYSPPYKTEFSTEDSQKMIDAINKVKQDVLFIGLTAPKQEKWGYEHFSKLSAEHICCIGAVFDFYAGTVKRAPEWMINIGLEWFYRLIKEPKRMWKRYLLGNTKFVWYVFLEKFSKKG